MQEPGGIGLLCACLISAYRAASPTITKENKKGGGGEGEKVFLYQENTASFLDENTG